MVGRYPVATLAKDCARREALNALRVELASPMGLDWLDPKRKVGKHAVQHCSCGTSRMARSCQVMWALSQLGGACLSGGPRWRLRCRRLQQLLSPRSRRMMILAQNHQRSAPSGKLVPRVACWFLQFNGLQMQRSGDTWNLLTTQYFRNFRQSR